MGGSAFDDLYTPRMSEAVYRSVLEQVESRYKKHFKHVAHPTEAPGKSSYGDIDVLVAEPFEATRSGNSPTSVFLASLIGGKRCKRSSGSSTTNIAINWPQEFAADIPLDNSNSIIDSPSHRKAAFIQVDLHICSTVDEMNWLLFLQAHGDLWNMLGGIIRRFGLTNTPKGLVLRIEEGEKYNKEQSRVRMTDEPAQVLQYLGLDVERYWRPFTTLDEMMSYAATCRFHDPGRWAEKNREALKANDRQRANKRPAFAYWADTFLPAHQNDAPGSDAHLSRGEVVEDAKLFFGEEFASRFDERKTTLLHRIRVDNMWATIRKSIPTKGTDVGNAMKGLKAAIVSGDDGEDFAKDELKLQEALASVRSAYEKGHFDEVLEWSIANWKEIGVRQQRLDQAKSHQLNLQKNQRGPSTAKQG